MRKNKFVRPWVLILTGAIVALFVVILMLNTVVSNIMYYKFRTICANTFNCTIKMNKPHVDIIKGEIVFKNIFLDRCITDSKLHASVENISIRVNIGGTLKGRIVLEDISLNKPIIQSHISPRKLMSSKDFQKAPRDLILGVIVSYLLKGSGLDNFAKIPDLLKARFGIKNMSINQARVEIDYDDVALLSIKSLDAQIKNIFYYPAQPTDVFLGIDFGTKQHTKVILKANADLSSSKGDFSLETKCSNIDITHIGQYYASAPIYVKEGTADISLIGTCRKGALDFSKHISMKNLFLSVKEEQDLDKQVLIGLTYRDIISYVKAKKGNIDLRFPIKGTLRKPEVDLSPIIENILAEIMALKISSGLQEWLK